MSGHFDTDLGARVWLGEMIFAGIDAVAICMPNARGRSLVNVLAVERREAPGVLCMPGGKVERAEMIRAAAARELREETGIRLHPSLFQWLGAIEIQQPDGALFGVAVYLVYTHAVPDDRQAEPGLRPRWHSLDDLCDPKHGRFARAAMLARQRLAAMA